MGLKYVLKSMMRRKLRTLIIALALTVGVALVGALLALVDTQRQFSIQTVGAQTGGYDLSITRSDLADTPFFDINEVEALARSAYPSINSAAIFSRIQTSVEARKAGALDGQSITFVAIQPGADNLVSVVDSSATSRGGTSILGIRIGNVGGGGRGGAGGGVRITGGGGGQGPGGQGGPPNQGQGNPNYGANGNSAGDFGSGAFTARGSGGQFPPSPGAIYLDSTTAGTLGVRVGDQVLMSYALPTPREVGKTLITGTSTPRIEATFTVAGIGVLNGLSSNTSNPVIMRMDDAQTWLGQAGQANQLLIVWQSSTAGTSDARVAVTQARDVGQQVRNELQSQLGDTYVVSLPKYTRLENTAHSYAFTQIFITLYGLLSIGIVGLMVNALMTTTVTEAKHDLAVLRVLGSPRKFL